MRAGCCDDDGGVARAADRGAQGAEKRACKEAARFVERHGAGAPKVAVLSCEGACIKGEVARTAANLLTGRLERDRSVRICLGDAVTGDSGMLDLVRRAPEVIAVEGCPLRCGSVLLARRAPEVKPTVIEAHRLYEYDREKYFEILDMERAQLDELARGVAEKVRARCFPG